MRSDLTLFGIRVSAPADLNSQPDLSEMCCIAPNFMADSVPAVALCPLRADELAALSARKLISLVREATLMREPDEAANAVLRQFYDRYKHAVARAARDILQQNVDVGDVVQEVFLRFWEGMAKYDTDQVKEGEEGDALVASYLARRATWLAKNRLRPEEAVDPRVIGLQTSDGSEEESASSHYAALHPFVREWLDGLNVQQRAVLEAYILNNEGRNTARVPREVVRRLCAQFDITPSALRHMKRHLIIRLKDYLNAHASEKIPT